MFIVFLRFAANKAKAGELMADHNAWIERGLADGVFLLVGTLQPGLGGALLAHDTTEDELRARVDADPFVAESVVAPEIMAIAPNRADERLSFLLG